MYLKKEDYRGRITAELLDQITGQTTEERDNVLADADKSARDIIDSYVGVLYTTSAEFSKTGAERNYQILNWAINIALYLLYQKISDYEVPEKIIKNYDDTIEDLQKISMGKTRINLPPIEPTEQDPSVGLRRIGSSEKRSHNI